MAIVETKSATSTTINVLIACCLLVLSGLFSGLTLGLMSLDMVSLEIVAEGGEVHERAYARKIIPVRAKGNLLLCTLLLGNTMVNGALRVTNLIPPPSIIPTPEPSHFLFHLFILAAREGEELPLSSSDLSP